jgi:uncharacterized protein (DUF433 family)
MLGPRRQPEDGLSSGEIIPMILPVSAATSPSSTGKPTVRGVHIPLELVISLLAEGETHEAILDDCPGSQLADIRACLAYTRAVLTDDRLDDVAVAHV